MASSRAGPESRTGVPPAQRPCLTAANDSGFSTGTPAKGRREDWYALCKGGAGDPPAPSGDPPGGMAVMSRCEKTVPFCSVPRPVPWGGSPDGTVGSPVLPTLNTYDPCPPGVRSNDHRPANSMLV